MINDFNNEKWIFIKNKPGLSWLTFKMKWPYSSKDAYYSVSVDPVDVFLVSLYITTLIYVIAFILYTCYLRVDWIRRYDRMTKLYRRDFYENKLDKLENVHILMIDIDHFKNVNDSYGHDVGDSVIKQVTQRIREHIRVKDSAIRWGGEEFIVIFPAMDSNDFINKAENLRFCIEAELIEGLAITISLGGVEKKESESVIEAIQRADIALYQSKNSGRNRVVIHKNGDDKE